MKIKIKIALLTIAFITILFYSDIIFIKSIRWIPFINVSFAFWIPFVLSLFLILTIYLSCKHLIKTKSRIAISLLVFIGIASSSFYSNPFYPEDFENKFLTKKHVGNNAKITCYLLVNCPFCEIASQKLNALYESGKITNIELVYFAYQETAHSLILSNNYSIPYSTMQNDSLFFKLAGNRFPCVQYQSENQIITWAGNNVNFACLDFLMKQ